MNPSLILMFKSIVSETLAERDKAAHIFDAEKEPTERSRRRVVQTTPSDAEAEPTDLPRRHQGHNTSDSGSETQQKRHSSLTSELPVRFTNTSEAVCSYKQEHEDDDDDDDEIDEINIVRNCIHIPVSKSIF